MLLKPAGYVVHMLRNRKHVPFLSKSHEDEHYIRVNFKKIISGFGAKMDFISLQEFSYSD
jgi:hypothetical protein